MRRSLGNLKSILIAFTFVTASKASAGYFELSGNGAYYLYNNGVAAGVDSTTTTLRFGGGIAYRFLSNTSFEVAYSQSKTTDRFGQVDSAYSISYDLTRVSKIESISGSLILEFAEKKSTFRPYIRAGGGYMTRTFVLKGTRKDSITGVKSDLTTTTTTLYSASATGGLGLRLFIADRIALEAEGTALATDLDKPEVFVHYQSTAGIRIYF
jgi:outer membrane protein W